MAKKATEKKILFVDDEPHQTGTYNQELQEELRTDGYEIHQESGVDAALQFFKKNQNHIALLILDIMMSPGSGEHFPIEKTQMGLRTGECFYDTIRQMAPTLPVIILTNVDDRHVKERF